MKNINNSSLLYICTLVMISVFAGCSSYTTKPGAHIPQNVPGINIPVIPLIPVPDKVKRYAGSRKWHFIVIHHSASNSGNAANFDRQHREINGWSRGLGYDFVIGNGNGSKNGLIEVGPRWVKQIDGAHAGVKKYNRFGIGICLVGNFDNTRPTGKQMSSLISLIRYFQERYNIPSENVILHKHVKTTACPGSRFPYFEILANIHTG
ncbi:MAG: peptidoglycan recognition protein family protein [Candidatus Anammoxibacter sp.]